MWFKNLQLYFSDRAWDLSPDAFEEALRAHTLSPVSGLQWSSEGWVSPRGDAQLTFSQDKQMLFAFGMEKKLLPSTIIRDEVAVRAKTFEQVKGFAPSRKHLRDLKEQITNELLPRAFGQRRVARAWLDPSRGMLAVDAPGLATADALIALFGRTLEGHGFARMEADPSPGAQMTRWLAEARTPAPFDLDSECELVSPRAERPSVHYARHSLDLPEIREHLASGKFAQRLRLRWQDRIVFTLDDQLQLKRIQVEDVESDAAEESDPDAAFAADFILMSEMEYRKFKRPFRTVWRVGSGGASAVLTQTGRLQQGFRHNAEALPRNPRLFRTDCRLRAERSPAVRRRIRPDGDYAVAGGGPRDRGR